jgi:FixJ family two-component response regulator
MAETKTVYVIDQDPSARQGLVRLLGKSGFDVVGCDSMETYLAYMEDELNGCLILDATTIGMMDETSLKAIQDRGDIAAVLVIAADDDAVSRDRARAMKAEAFFRKPVDGTALLDAIRWSTQ